jgi:hypothetical protein
MTRTEKEDLLTKLIAFCKWNTSSYSICFSISEDKKTIKGASSCLFGESSSYPIATTFRLSMEDSNLLEAWVLSVKGHIDHYGLEQVEDFLEEEGVDYLDYAEELATCIEAFPFLETWLSYSSEDEIEEEYGR